MATTLVSRKGSILNAGERAVAYLGNMLERDDLAPYERFRCDHVRTNILEMYMEAQKSDLALLFLETELRFQREPGNILQEM